MGKYKLFSVLLLLLLLWGGTVLAQDSNPYISRYVVSSGGGTCASTNYLVQDVKGQPAQGTSTSTNFLLHAGFFPLSAPYPDISVEPSSIDFGLTLVGTSSAPQTVTVSNNGTASLIISSVLLTGTNPDQFSMVSDNWTGKNIAPGASDNLQVIYQPTVSGSHSANLTFSSNDPDENPFNVLLSGNAKVAGLSLSKSADNTISKVGDTITYTYTITNTGEVELQRDSVSDNISGHIIYPAFPDTLAEGASANITYNYIVQTGDTDPLHNTITALYYVEGFSSVISANATCTVDLVHPYILVTKAVAAGAYGAGDSITYLVRIDNTSTDITLVKDTVTDSLAGNITSLFSDNITAKGSDNQTYTYTVKATDPDPLINDVTANYHPQGLTNDIIDSTYANVFLAPTITSVSPSQGTPGQTLNVTINGSQLNRVNAVDFGAGITVNGLLVNSSTQITANISIDANAVLGPRDITVSNPTGLDTLIGGFTVKQLPSPPQPPSVVSPTPRSSPQPPRPTMPIVSLQYLNIHPQQTHANQTVTITTNVVNIGDEAGSYNVILKINGRVERTRMVSVGPQGTQPVKFTVTRSQPGTYTVNIGDQSGRFTVTGAGSRPRGGMVAGSLIAAVTAIIVILAGLVIILARRRFQGY